MEYRPASPWPLRIGLLILFVVGTGLVAWKQLSRDIARHDAAQIDASELAWSLMKLRNAIDLYHAEHLGRYPVAVDGISVGDLLTKCSTVDGTSVGTPDPATGRVYGPYLDEIPRLPVGVRKGSSGIGTADAPGVGWILDSATGSLIANTNERDRTGKAYANY